MAPDRFVQVSTRGTRRLNSFVTRVSIERSTSHQRPQHGGDASQRAGRVLACLRCEHPRLASSVALWCPAPILQR